MAVFSKRKRISRKSKPKKELKMTIQRQIDKNLEVKTWQAHRWNTAATDFGNSANFPNTNVFPVAPSSGFPLSIGDTTDNRIGNRIRVKSARLRLRLMPHEYDNSGAVQNLLPKPMNIRLIIAHSKATPTALVVSSTFFRLGSGTVTPADAMQDTILEVNKDIYVVSFDRTVKLGNSAVDIPASASYDNNQDYQANDYNLNQSLDIDITRMLPKVLEFNNTTTVPTSFMPNLIMLASPADGTALAADEYPFKYYVQVTVNYTDA